jgi:hypothetical protein
MRAKEFIIEKKIGKISKHDQQSSRGITTYGDEDRMNSDYVSFKLGQAMAMADGSGKKLDMDGMSWYGKKKTIQPYTELEHDMFKQAAKAVGASYNDVNKGDMRSRELDSTNTVSPVSNWMKKK